LLPSNGLGRPSAGRNGAIVLLSLPSNATASLAKIAALAFALAMAGGTSAVRADVNSVTVNGVPMAATENVMVRGGAVFVPMRSVFEKLGATVTYNGKIATAKMNGADAFDATLGSTSATIKGAPSTLSAAPFGVGDHVYIPLSALATLFGAKYTHGPNGYVISAPVLHAVSIAAPSVQATLAPAPAATGGFNWWPWLLGLIALVLLGWLLMRGRPAGATGVSTGTAAYVPPKSSGVSPGGVAAAATGLAPMLLQLIPNLSADHRAGLGGSILDTVGSVAGINTNSILSGDAGPLASLVRAVAERNPQGLIDAVKSYATSNPAFLDSIPPGILSQLKGYIGL
jgi:hypothetical protein